MTDAADGTEDWYNSDLYKLLREGFPQYRGQKQRLDVRALADHLGYSYEPIYRWFRAGKLNLQNAKRVAAKSNGLITLDELLPFALAD